MKALYDVVALAERRGFPVIAGTEMNAPGQKFVDAFDADELRPLAPAFLRGAYIVTAHTALQRACGIGYLGPWADAGFKSIEAKNTFFEAAGRALRPGVDPRLSGVDAGVSPARLLERLQ